MAEEKIGRQDRWRENKERKVGDDLKIRSCSCLFKAERKHTESKPEISNQCLFWG